MENYLADNIGGKSGLSWNLLSDNAHTSLCAQELRGLWLNPYLAIDYNCYIAWNLALLNSCSKYKCYILEASDLL